MDREDKRRYFIVGSVILEIVTPMFQQRLEKEYKKRGFPTFQAFLNSDSVIHILFHLRHRNVWCCVDKKSCSNHDELPLVYDEWDLLYTPKKDIGSNHSCHCQYTANSVELEELDYSLAGLILLNCFALGKDENTISSLRQFKSDYLCHNTCGSMDKEEFDTLWDDLQDDVLRLDPSKQDELMEIKERPLDDRLRVRYCKILLGIIKPNEVDNREPERCPIQDLCATLLELRNLIVSMNTRMRPTTSSANESNKALGGVRCQSHTDCSLRKQYQLGQDIFCEHSELDLTKILNDEQSDDISDAVIMDDGKLVICLWNTKKLLICNADGSQPEIIQCLGQPVKITAVNDSTVAVIFMEMPLVVYTYDINARQLLRTITVPDMHHMSSVTTIENKLLIGGDQGLWTTDPDTGKTPQKLPIECQPLTVHACGDRIFYNELTNENILNCYTTAGHEIFTTSLQSSATSVFTLQDGSLYVSCRDGTIQHVSSDGEWYTTVTTEELTSLKGLNDPRYNQKQKKLITFNEPTGFVHIFNQM
ncbi:Hypothetical predicted protein [Mytilus galloprovincialis]|nr:Hypothetical predicted protein [Mytilus galloprovincialis]